jgi:hypothetical protein
MLKLPEKRLHVLYFWAKLLRHNVRNLPIALLFKLRLQNFFVAEFRHHIFKKTFTFRPENQNALDFR